MSHRCLPFNRQILVCILEGPSSSRCQSFFTGWRWGVRVFFFMFGARSRCTPSLFLSLTYGPVPLWMSYLTIHPLPWVGCTTCTHPIMTPESPLAAVWHLKIRRSPTRWWRFCPQWLLCVTVWRWVLVTPHWRHILLPRMQLLWPLDEHGTTYVFVFLSHQFQNYNILDGPLLLLMHRWCPW